MKLIRKYILFEFLKPLITSILVFMILTYISETFRINGIKEKNFTFGFVFLYLFFQTPTWLVQTLPVATLLAALFSVGNMQKTNELTAIFTAGISPFRLFIHLFIFSVLLSFFSFALNERLAPAAYRKAEYYYREKILNEKISTLDRREFLVVPYTDNSFFYAESFDPLTDKFTNLFYVRTDGEKNITGSIFSAGATISGNEITFTNPFFREIKTGGNPKEWKAGSHTMKTFYTASDFARENIKPEKMNYAELKGYIEKARLKGLRSIREECQLYQKTSLPFSSVIVFTFGVVIALRIRSSKFISFSLSLAVTFLYYGIMSISLSLGEKGILSPLVSAWLGNIIILAATFLV